MGYWMQSAVLSSCLYITLWTSVVLHSAFMAKYSYSNSYYLLARPPGVFVRDGLLQTDLLSLESIPVLRMHLRGK